MRPLSGRKEGEPRGIAARIMRDEIVSASAPEDGFAVTAAITTDLVRETQRRHGLSPTATATAGRLITGAALMGAGLKDTLRISLQVTGDGPLQRVAAEAWLTEGGRVGARAYAKVPHADLPLNAAGKFDVAGAVGTGTLHVTKAYEEGQPYSGVVPLHSGEIAEDLAAYLLKSEQIPSVVALGVLAGPNGVVAAGGVIAQVLPDADERAVAALERRALELPPVTTLIADGADARALLEAFAGSATLRSVRTLDVGFACRCTREKVETALAGLGADELRKMARENPETEATCEFCKSVYLFSSAELAELVTLLKKA
jgi:molecular chaperone Hsp33